MKRTVAGARGRIRRVGVEQDRMRRAGARRQGAGAGMPSLGRGAGTGWSPAAGCEARR
jgi:hypothetical protein